MTANIDIVIPWVDQSDEVWKQSMLKWAAIEGRELADSSDERFRDWDILRYLFRSIEANMPWVHKIHFITCGHLPGWMNTDASKLNIVKHEEYIPADYLPTFSSHCIELNIHRIKGLSDHFIYFNDDMLVLKPLQAEEFFKDGLPRDYAILNAFISSHRYSVMDTALTNIEIINDHFPKNEMIKKNFSKWFNIRYGTKISKTFLMMPWKMISNFYGQHSCVAYNKDIFDEVWREEFDVLDSTCRHHFRTRRDVNQWLMREWQLASGKFVPISPSGAGYYVIDNDNSQIFKAIKEKKHKIMCINDVIGQNISDFDTIKKELIKVLEEAYPVQSEYEK